MAPERLRQVLLGWLNPGLSYTFSLLGLATTTASLSTLLWATEPILILILAWLVLREPLSSRFISLSGVAVQGVLLVGGLLGGSSVAGEWRGMALILAGVFGCALYTVLARRWNIETDTLFSLAIQQSAALAWAAGLWPFERFITATGTAFPPDGPTWLWSALAGLLYYALAFWFYRALAGVGLCGWRLADVVAGLWCGRRLCLSRCSVSAAAMAGRRLDPGFGAGHRDATARASDLANWSLTQPWLGRPGRSPLAGI